MKNEGYTLTITRRSVGLIAIQMFGWHYWPINPFATIGLLILGFAYGLGLFDNG